MIISQLFLVTLTETADRCQTKNRVSFRAVCEFVNKNETLKHKFENLKKKIPSELAHSAPEIILQLCNFCLLPTSCFLQPFLISVLSSTDDRICTSEARYTLFVFIREQCQNHFFAKKFEFRETGRKHPYTLFVIDSSFCEYEFRLPSNEKSPLSFVQKPLRRAKTAQNEKPVRETSAKMLYTLLAFCSFFVISLIFRYCSR